jgi:hypothetical protein
MSARKKRGCDAIVQYLPETYIAPWNTLFDEVAACLADDKRSRYFLPDLVEAARTGAYWPTRTLSDEHLLTGFCDLVLAFVWAPESRRPWLGDLLQVLKDGAEGPVGLCSPPRSGPLKAPEPPAVPPPPGPGEPGHRADIDG